MRLKFFIIGLLFFNFLSASAARIKFSAPAVEILSQDTIQVGGKKITLCGILNHYGKHPGVDSIGHFRKLLTANKENLSDPLELEYYQAGADVHYGVLWNRGLNISAHSINEIMILEGYNRAGLRDGICSEMLSSNQLQKFEKQARANQYGIWKRGDGSSTARTSSAGSYDCRYVVKFNAPNTLTVMIDSFQNLQVSLDIWAGGKQKSYAKEWTAGKKKLKFPSQAAEKVKLSLKFNKNRRGFCPIEID